jgi:hypothetical protein
MTRTECAGRICGFSGCRTLSKLEAVTRDICAAGGGAKTAKADSLDEQSVKKHTVEVAKKATRIDVSLNAISAGGCIPISTYCPQSSLPERG